MTIVILVAAAVGLLLWSWRRDRRKTRESALIAKTQLLSIGPKIAAILALIGLILAVIPQQYIQALLGGTSTLLSTVYAAVIGTITILPAFVAFPLSASLVERGAHVVAVAAFITTLTMVGFATLPIEIDYFGKRFALLRNGTSFLAALFIAVGMGLLL